jgi:hypothetical protein
MLDREEATLAIFPVLNISIFQALQMALGLALWQQPTARPQWLTYAFLIALIVTIIFFLWRFEGPGLSWLLGLIRDNIILISALVTTGLFFVLLFNLNPFPYIRHGAELIGLGQLVNFDTAFADGLPDAVAQNIGVVSVVRADTDADGFEEWVVFYLFDKRAQNSPLHGAVYDNDRGNPPVIFPYQLQAPDRNYLSEQQVYGPGLIIQDVAADQNGPNGANVPEIIVQGANELTIFRFHENSVPWSFPTDSPARYQPIGFFRGSGGVSINLNQGAAAYGQVTVIDRNGFERSQLAIRSVYGLLTGPDGNQTYLDPIPPLGGVGGPHLAAPILSTVDFHPTPPDEIFNTPFPEKIVLGFYAATCGAADNSLCNSNTTASELSWRPPNSSLGNFLAGEALGAFNSGNPNYFSLPAFSNNSNILVSQLRYYPQFETDSDLLETGGGRDVVTGEQGQIGCVEITFTINGSASQEASYEMGLSVGQWKIVRRLSSSCTEPPPPPPTPTPFPPPAPTPGAAAREGVSPLKAEANGPYAALVCQDVIFSSAGSIANDPGITYEWNFGDGNFSTDANPTHSYAYPGVYTATLTMRDNAGQSSADAAAVTISLPSPAAPPPCGPPPCCG